MTAGSQESNLDGAWSWRLFSLYRSATDWLTPEVADSTRLGRPAVRRGVFAVVVLALVVTGCGGTKPATIRYNPDGVQMTCTASQAGQVVTVTGDGAPFTARCDQDGPVYVWDAQN